MFNGIIYNQGIVTKIIKRPKGLNIFVKSNLKVTKKDIGLSVACDGVCLTLISFKSKLMEFYLSKETLVRSKFKYLNTKDKLNLEGVFSSSAQIVMGGDVSGTANAVVIGSIDGGSV